MNIIFFSENMKKYKSANYQREFMNELKKNELTKVFFYGPGFPNFNKLDDLNTIIKKSSFKNKIILFVGHSWLSDNQNLKTNNKINNNLDFKSSEFMKVVFLNKEYVNLNEKIKFIKENKFNLGFTHHHEISKYEKLTKIKFHQIPFAFSSNLLNQQNKKKYYDICFTGVLQNQNKNSFQSDIRLKVMKVFFITLFDIPIFKRKRFKDINVYWNTIPRYKFGKIIKKIFFKSLNNDQYIEILKNSKISLNFLSPINLISPRYFESVACGARILCEESDLYKNLFKDYDLKQFKSNLSDFENSLFELLKKIKSNESINNSNTFLSKNSWKNRVQKVINLIEQNDSI